MLGSRRPLIGASDLRRIYIQQYSKMPVTYFIHIGLQWKVGDHTTLQGKQAIYLLEIVQ